MATPGPIAAPKPSPQCARAVWPVGGWAGTSPSRAGPPAAGVAGSFQEVSWKFSVGFLGAHRQHHGARQLGTGHAATGTPPCPPQATVWPPRAAPSPPPPFGAHGCHLQPHTWCRPAPLALALWARGHGNVPRSIRGRTKVPPTLGRPGFGAQLYCAYTVL